MLKKIQWPFLAVLLIGCSSDEEETPLAENQAPRFTESTLSVAEHSPPGTLIGRLRAVDDEGDPIAFEITSSDEFEIDPASGELFTTASTLLDFEESATKTFNAAITDGLQRTDRDMTINVTDVDEMELLNAEEQELLAYFKFLALWQGPFNTELAVNTKWNTPMKIYLDGNLDAAFVETVNNTLAELNGYFSSGDFSISLTDDIDSANTHLFFGEKEAVADVWSDMYELIDGETYNGFAMTSGSETSISGARIWLSNPAQVLLLHELGHSLGLGHSDQCDEEKSFMCSNITLESSVLESEKEVFRLMYHDKVDGGLSAAELDALLANILVVERP